MQFDTREATDAKQKKVWILETWYEKTLYTLSVIYAAFLALMFVVGFVVGLLG